MQNKQRKILGANAKKNLPKPIMDPRYSKELGNGGPQGGINCGGGPAAGAYMGPMPVNQNIIVGQMPPQRGGGGSKIASRAGPPFSPMPMHPALLPPNHSAFNGPHAQSQLSSHAYYNNNNGGGDGIGCNLPPNDHVVNVNGNSNGGTYIANANFANRPNIYSGNLPPPSVFNVLQVPPPNHNGRVNILSNTFPGNNMPTGQGGMFLTRNTVTATTSMTTSSLGGPFNYTMAGSSCTSVGNQVITTPLALPQTNPMLSYFNVNANTPPPPPPPPGHGMWLPAIPNNHNQIWGNIAVSTSPPLMNEKPAETVTQGTQTPVEKKRTTVSVGIQCVLISDEANSTQSGEVKAAKMASSFEELLQDIDQTMSMPNIGCQTNARLTHDDDNSSGAVEGGIGSGSGAFITREEYDTFIRLAQCGSDIAEKVASAHRHRPCFKKIDSLCARLRQDLMRQDSVLPNINSQGYAWAVKDFIFVFTRIINAWIIMKGYIYNTQAGLNRVRSCLTSQLIESFLSWQEATFSFIAEIIKSFVNLDNLVQTQKNGFQKPAQDDIGVSGENAPLTKDNVADVLNEDNVLNRNYIFTNVTDMSELTQHEAEVNGTYFRTGTYKPIKKTDLPAIEPQRLPNGNICNLPPMLPSAKEPAAAVAGGAHVMVSNRMQHVTATSSANNSYACAKTAKPVPALKPIQQDPCLSVMPFSVTSNDPGLSTMTTQRMLTSTPNNQHNNSMANTQFRSTPPPSSTPTFPEMLANSISNSNATSNGNDNAEGNSIQQNLVPYMRAQSRTALESNDREESERLKKIRILGERLMELNGAEYFYRYHRIKDLFPDFYSKHSNDFEDLYTIISKIHKGNTYIDVFQIVNHVKRVIFAANKYLRITNNKFLAKSIRRYEEELNKIITSAPFEAEHLDQVIGTAKEEEIFIAVYRYEEP